MDGRKLHWDRQTQGRGKHVTGSPLLREFATVIAVLVWQVGEKQDTPA